MATHSSSSKIISADAVKALLEGSHEHLGVALDEAIAANPSKFGPEGSEFSKIATFSDHAIIGRSDGVCLNVKFEHRDGEVVFTSVDEIDLPVVSTTNGKRSAKDLTLSAVDALMSESVEKAGRRLVELAELHAQDQVVEARDYVAEALALAHGGRPWREIFAAQSKEINRQVVDKLESIRAGALAVKYTALYEGDSIPEEQFHLFRESAETDLMTLLNRIADIGEATQNSFFPLAESIDFDALEQADDEVLGHFCAFSEDLIDDLSEVHALLADTLENEQCVMCLGQVYDTFAESLVDYEIAGSFVQRMAGSFNEAA